MPPDHLPPTSRSGRSIGKTWARVTWIVGAIRGDHDAETGLQMRGEPGTVNRRGTALVGAAAGRAALRPASVLSYGCQVSSMLLPSPDEWRAAGRTFRFRGHEVFVRVGGQGPGLLLIHGFPTASWDWCKLWPELAQHFTLVAPDLLGFGFSAKPPRHDYRIAEQAELCLAALAEVGITGTHVLAHDYGDTVAQELLARAGEGRCPVALQSVVLLNGGLFPETHRPLLSQRLLRSALGPLVATLMTKGRLASAMRRIGGSRAPLSSAETDAFWDLLSRGHGQRAMPRLIRYIDERRARRARWVGALQRTTVPILLIAGMDDPISGAHMVARFRELVPTAPVVELPGVGHYPQLEAPAAVLDAARRAFDAASTVPRPSR